MYNGGSTGTATLTNTSVSGNSAAFGGGVTNWLGKVTLQNNCTVSGNSADWGGGLYNFYGTAKLSACTISGNSGGIGGGVFDEAGKTTLTNYCTVSNNSATVSGGGVYNDGGKATLTNCTVTGNSAAVSGGGLFNIAGYYGGTAALTELHRQRQLRHQRRRHRQPGHADRLLLPDPHEPGGVRGWWHRHDLGQGDDHRFHHQQQPGQLDRDRPGRRDLQ